MRLEGKKSMTLIEILIALLIMGVIVASAIPIARKGVERSRNNEARSLVRLIHEAELMYKNTLELGIRPCTDNADCSDRLPVAIPAGADANWNYQVNRVGVNGFCVQADSTALNTPPRSFHMRQIDVEPQDCSCGLGNCPVY